MKVTAVSMLAGLVLAGLVGCGPKIPADQTVAIELRETTGAYPVRMSVIVDGQEVFGPHATLAPGEKQRIVINGVNNQQKSGQHQVLYTFDRRGVPGVLGHVGHAEIAALTGDDKIFVDNSDSVLIGWWTDLVFYYRIKK